MLYRMLAMSVAAVLAMGLGCGADAPENASGGTGGAPPGKVFVYCAAGLSAAVSELEKSFEAEGKGKVELTFMNSGQLLAQIEVSRTGDLYLPAEIGYVDQAREKGLLVGEPMVICRVSPVILVAKGNPKGVKGLDDLVKPGLRLSLAAEKAAIGRVQARVFARNGLDAEALKRNTFSTPATVNEVAADVKLGKTDVGIVWDAVAFQFRDDTEVVTIPPDRNETSDVAAAVLSCAANRTGAEAFAAHLASPAGQKVFAEWGYTVTEAGR